jgi:hypothetical protein
MAAARNLATLAAVLRERHFYFWNIVARRPHILIYGWRRVWRRWS